MPWLIATLIGRYIDRSDRAQGSQSIGEDRTIEGGRTMELQAAQETERGRWFD